MATKWSQPFYSSYQWKKCRAAFISYKRGLCERCLKKGILTPGNHVHHKIFLTADNINDPSVTCNFDNLELLCEKCHEDLHHSYAQKERFKVSKDGRVEGRESDVR